MHTYARCLTISVGGMKILILVLATMFHQENPDTDDIIKLPYCQSLKLK